MNNRENKRVLRRSSSPDNFIKLFSTKSFYDNVVEAFVIVRIEWVQF